MCNGQCAFFFSSGDQVYSLGPILPNIPVLPEVNRHKVLKFDSPRSPGSDFETNSTPSPCLCRYTPSSCPPAQLEHSILQRTPTATHETTCYFHLRGEQFIRLGDGSHCTSWATQNLAMSPSCLNIELQVPTRPVFLPPTRQLCQKAELRSKTRLFC